MQPVRDVFEREAWKALLDESGVHLFSDDNPEEETTDEDNENENESSICTRSS